MDVVNRCCAGLDVHKRTVVACLLRRLRRLGYDVTIAATPDLPAHMDSPAIT